MAQVQMQELLQAGVHFGHQTHRWNPKMRKYIFAERGGIYLIDLKKTQQQLERATRLIEEVMQEGESVLFVCTKPQLADLVRQEAERCGAFYVTERWLGGMLTNFQTIKKNIRRLKELERGAEEGAFDFYTKKEQLLLDRERQKLERYLSGIKQMGRLPGLVFVVDAAREEIAVKEAHRLEIPLVAIADTNADPDMLSIPIPGNDDAIRSVALITRRLADAVDRARREAPEAGDEAEAYTYSSDVGETSEGKQRRKRPRRRLKPEVIARRRQQQEEGGEEVIDEDVAEDLEEVADAGAEAVDEIEEIEEADETAEATEDEDEEAADEEEREVPVATAAAEEEEDEEESGS